jgi:peptide/nickel transport system permease protein
MRWSTRDCETDMGEPSDLPLKTLAAAVPPGLRGEPAGSPLVMAFRRLGRVWSVRISILVLALMALAAIYAPFLCNDSALAWHDQDGWRFPVLTELFNARYFPHWYDLMFNLLALETPVIVIAGWALLRFMSPLRRWCLITGCFAASMIACCLPVIPGAEGHRCLWRDRSDTHSTLGDYQAQLPAGTVQRWALFPPVPHPFSQTYDGMSLKPPGAWDAVTRTRFWLGTDTVGKDVLSVLVYGTRISLTIGLVASGISLIIGTLIGAISGFSGGWIDLVLQRLVEIFMCLPTFLLIVLIVAMLGRDIFIIMTVIGLTGWAGTARLVRGEFLAQTVRDYVMAGESLGLSRMRLMFRHILPNALTPLIITATFSIAGAVLSESGLSFLGLGDASVPTWGGVLNQGREAIEYGWLIYAPGIAIFLLVTALNIVGSEMREAMDPKGNT